jgi:glyoxylase-like metal-dependent hydrolase (beta-lactamase superfamily II)
MKSRQKPIKIMVLSRIFNRFKITIYLYISGNNMNSLPIIHTIDLNFLDCPNAIASYLVPYQDGLILIESGPGSTQEQLAKAISALGFDLKDISHVLLTHIHLDHAGAAGWLAERGAQVFVHERGYPHMLDPTKLLASASRIYKEQMDYLWGEFLAVPEGQLVSLTDNTEIQIGAYTFRSLDTPGHANHHMAYLLDEFCFSGDVGGVRIQSPGPRHLRLPMPPPEFHPPRWRISIERLKNEKITLIAPTHFGIFSDVDWHLGTMLRELDAVEAWMEEIMPRDLAIEDLRKEFVSWMKNRSGDMGLSGGVLAAFEKANPSGMSADGIKRYWEKYILNK